MKFEFFLNHRLISEKSIGKGSARALIRISVFGISLCIAVMIVAMSILSGFKNEIRNKISGFNAHIQITNLSSNLSYETFPIDTGHDFLKDLRKHPEIQNIQQYATKPGILKRNTEYAGVILKGVAEDYDWTFFSSYLQEGSVLTINKEELSNEVMISSKLALSLQLRIGDTCAMYFIQEPVRMRKFIIKGIYRTDFDEFDKVFLICDIKHVARLNDWKNGKISGYEVLLKDFDKLDAMHEVIIDQVGFSLNSDQTMLKTISIRDKYPQIFDWLSLQDKNVIIIIILLLIVAGFNMISALMILILERTSMIGLLKSLGSSNLSIIKLFLLQAFYLLSKGLIWGNLVGLILVIIQKYTHVIGLNPESYYISYVPIHIDLLSILFLNIGVIISTFLMLLLPSLAILSLDPVKSIKYE